MKIKKSKAIDLLPPYTFAAIDEIVAKKREEGVDIINFAIGDPDLPTPKHIIKAAQRAATKPENHRYPPWKGKLELREAIAKFYRSKWKIDIDPDQVLVTVGAKEGIHNAAFAFDQGTALIPNPRYPVYYSGAVFSYRPIKELPLQVENDFMPNLSSLSDEEAKHAAYLWLNYPNNPTTALGDRIIDEAIDFCKDHQIPLLYDNTYSEITFDDYNAPTPLRKGLEVTAEFHSFSKTYNMTGWRIGWIVGDKTIINAIETVKKNVDTGAPNIAQDAAIAALKGPQDCVSRNVEIYQERRDMLVSGLRKLGYECSKPKATFYIWMPVPEEFKKYQSPSMEFANYLIRRAGIVVTPGVGFGKYGEGYVRWSLTQPIPILEKALERLEKLNRKL